MSEAELIWNLREARKLLHKESAKPVEECLPVYRKILLDAYNHKLKIDPLDTPGGMISDLQNAGYLMDPNYRMLTGIGKEYVQTNLL